jgi:hypothetical protein
MNRPLSETCALVALGLGLPLALPDAARAADYATTVVSTPNLLGYWRFSTSTQANSSVNGYTGTFVDNAHVGPAASGPTLAFDPTNTAAVVDGNGDLVQTSLVGQVDTQGSIVGWFNLSALPSTTGRIYAVAGESQAANDFDIGILTDDRLRFYTDNGSSTDAPTAFTAADLNQWHFVAATFVANQTNGRTLYLDGVQVAQSTPGGHALGMGQFDMGASAFFSGRFFQGQLDEFAVYNRALTSAEVTTIYQSRTQLPEPAAAGVLALGALCAPLATRRARSR